MGNISTTQSLYANSITANIGMSTANLSVNSNAVINSANVVTNLQVGNNLRVNGNLNVQNTAEFAANLSVANGASMGGNLAVGSGLAVAGNGNIQGNLSVGLAVSALSASIGSFDQVNSRGSATVQVLQSNGSVSGNTWVLDGAAQTSNSSLPQVIDSWSVTVYRTAHYLLQITNTVTQSYQASQLMLIQDGTDVWFTEYADIYTNGSLGSWSADIVSGMVELMFTPNSSQNMVIKVVRTALDL